MSMILPLGYAWSRHAVLGPFSMCVSSNIPFLWQGSSNYSEAESRNKNVDEYNATADKYEAWCKTNSLMQNYCYYSTFAELEKVSDSINYVLMHA